MESFFLSETVKYLYLLFSNATALVDHFVFSTEGHFFPPFPSPAAAAQSNASQHDASGGSGGGSVGRPPTCAVDGLEAVARAAGQQQWQRGLKSYVAEKCQLLCQTNLAEEQATAEELAAALPLVPLVPGWRRLLRERRCKACEVVTRAVTTARRRKSEQLQSQAARAAKGTQSSSSGGGGGRAAASDPVLPKADISVDLLPGVSVSGYPILRQFLCPVVEVRPGKLGCARIQEVSRIQEAWL